MIPNLQNFTKTILFIAAILNKLKEINPTHFQSLLQNPEYEGILENIDTLKVTDQNREETNQKNISQKDNHE